MIYLHHTPLSKILLHDATRLTQQKREIIRAYRHDILTKFCQSKNLPTPIYDKQAFGKPFITNSPLSFNQSHCVSDYVLAFSLTTPNIGVDIEHLGRQVKFEPLAKRCFHDDEYQLWQNNGYDKHLWFKIWTIKEAVLKAQGLGIRLNLNELNAVFTSDNGGYVCHDKIGWFYFKNLIINECMITLACPFDCDNMPIVLI